MVMQRGRSTRDGRQQGCPVLTAPPVDAWYVAAMTDVNGLRQMRRSAAGGCVARAVTRRGSHTADTAASRMCACGCTDVQAIAVEGGA